MFKYASGMTIFSLAAFSLIGWGIALAFGGGFGKVPALLWLGVAMFVSGALVVAGFWTVCPATGCEF
jgi:hypothetical protein